MRIIEKCDYENYKFPIPVTELLGKRRKKYIYGELEKRHPCFNDLFSFEENILLKRNGFLVDVYVINKIKLHEYKNKYSFSGFGFILENKKGRFHFSDKKKIGLLIIVGITLFFFLHEVTKIKLHNKKTEVIKAIEVQEESIEKDSHSGELLESVLKIIDEGKGKISSLVVKSDGYFEELKVSLINVYPEEFEEFGEKHIESINYENGIPYMSFETKGKIKSERAIRTGGISSNSSIRNILKQNDCKILEERIEPVNFLFISNKDLSILSQIYEEVCNSQSGIKNLKIQNKNDEYLIEIGLFDFITENGGLDLSTVVAYQDLFRLKDKKIIKNEKTKQEMTENKTTDLKLVGSINQENGVKINFYKNKEGKILQITEGK